MFKMQQNTIVYVFFMIGKKMQRTSPLNRSSTSEGVLKKAIISRAGSKQFELVKSLVENENVRHNLRLTTHDVLLEVSRRIRSQRRRQQKHPL